VLRGREGGRGGEFPPSLFFTSGLRSPPGGRGEREKQQQKEEGKKKKKREGKGKKNPFITQSLFPPVEGRGKVKKKD